MKMKLLFALVAGLIPVSLMAQDDLYFKPKKSTEKIRSSYEPIGGSDRTTSIKISSNRDVDEYNRKGLKSYFQKVGTDSLGNDIVEFISNEASADTLHVYPGTEVKYDMEDDYAYSRRMSRFDDYYWYDPWFYSYGYGYGPYWSPWNYHWGLYDPWYYGWYDPWYYDWHYGWHSGWYYPYHYTWGHPIYVGGGSRPIYANNGITGTRNHGRVNRGGATNRENNFNGYRGNGHSVASNGKGSGSGNFGGYRGGSSSSSSRASYSSNSSYSSRNSSFGGSRSSSSSYSNNSSSNYTPPQNSSPSYNSGSSFGGSRSGGGGSFGGGGGSRSVSSGGGGGHSGGGGGHFGGRR